MDQAHPWAVQAVSLSGRCAPVPRVMVLQSSAHPLSSAPTAWRVAGRDLEPGETRNQPRRDLTCRELSSTAAFQQRLSWPCSSEHGVITKPGCWTPAQGNNHHLSSRGNESSSSSDNGTRVPTVGRMSLLPFQLFLCRAAALVFHRALCCRLLLGITAEPSPCSASAGKAALSQHWDVSMCKETPDTAGGLWAEWVWHLNVFKNFCFLKNRKISCTYLSDYTSREYLLEILWFFLWCWIAEALSDRVQSHAGSALHICV